MKEIKTFTINNKEIKTIIIDEFEDWKNDNVFIVYHDNRIKKIVEHKGEIKRYTTLMFECFNPEYDKQLGIIPFYEIAPSFKD